MIGEVDDVALGLTADSTRMAAELREWQDGAVSASVTAHSCWLWSMLPYWDTGFRITNLTPSPISDVDVRSQRSQRAHS